MPCSIAFDGKNPGPINVSVRRNGDGNRHRDGGRNQGGIRERDDCSSRNVATITRDSRGVFTVTAGSSIGKCDAQFDAGNGNRNDRDGGGSGGGGGNLQIVNRI